MTEAHLSCCIVTSTGSQDGAVIVREGLIQAVCPRSEVPADAVQHEWGNVAILPGLVDTHVHMNEPGRTEWEGFRTGTRAAAAGGFTTLVDMPLNCLPETTTVAALEAKRAAAHGKCWVDWMSWGGAVDGNQSELEPLAKAGVPGYKCFLIYPGCEGFTSIDVANLRDALPHIAATGLPLLVHAEMQGPIDTACASLPAAEDPAWRQYRTYLGSRPDEAEIEAIQTLIELCRRFHFRLHIVHLGTAQAVPMLRAARQQGLPITVETCPHYLHLCADDIEDGATEFKCAPPVRSRANRELLWQALRDGDIDLIASDHSPCPPAMKRKADGRFNVAWGGIASLSTALRVVWTEASARGFTLQHVAQWMSTAPATLAGLASQAGLIKPGRPANLLFFDPDAQSVVTSDDLHYRHPVSPYLGESLRGSVIGTMLRGAFVFREGEFALVPRGRELRPDGWAAPAADVC